MNRVRWLSEPCSLGSFQKRGVEKLVSSCGQSGEGSRAAREAIRLDSEALQHGHEEVGQRGVVLRAEFQVSAVLEGAAGEDEGQIAENNGVT